MPVNIFTTIDDPLATQDTDPFGINGSGQIVGAFRTNSVFHGFVLSGGSFTTLDAHLATSTQAFGINDAGQIVGFFSVASTTHGFLQSGGTFIPIDDPSAGPGSPGGTVARGINNAGQIVGSFTDASVKTHGFLRSSAGTFTTFDDPSASAILITNVMKYLMIYGAIPQCPSACPISFTYNLNARE